MWLGFRIVTLGSKQALVNVVSMFEASIEQTNNIKLANMLGAPSS